MRAALESRGVELTQGEVGKLIEESNLVCYDKLIPTTDTSSTRSINCDDEKEIVTDLQSTPLY